MNSEKNNKEERPKYWTERELENKAIKAKLEMEKSTEGPIKKVSGLYKRIERDIHKEIQHIYDTYAKRTKETADKVDEYLTNAEKQKADAKLLYKIEMAKNEKERNELVNIYNSQSAMYRMSKLENLKNNISVKLITLASTEEDINKKHYEKILVNKDNKFSTLKLELQEKGAFNSVTKHMVDEVLEQKWYSSNYSDRIWNNKDRLQNALDEILDKGLIQGHSMQKMAREFRDATATSLFNATRLIRTESAYYHGQVTLREYEELGVTKYKFTAKLDHRTSVTCRKHDDKVYLVSEAKVGVNYPPMHPHCRSTTVPVIEENNKEEIQKETFKSKDRIIVKDSNILKNDIVDYFDKYNKDINLLDKAFKEENYYIGDLPDIEEFKNNKYKEVIINKRGITGILKKHIEFNKNSTIEIFNILKNRSIEIYKENSEIHFFMKTYKENILDLGVYIKENENYVFHYTIINPKYKERKRKRLKKIK